jgi:glycosyltransferase involved in cell wall biosynthesis
MPNRLEDSNNKFWFNINELQSFKDVIATLIKLKPEEIQEIAKSNRQIYLNKYRVDTIKNQYKNTIFKLLKNQN